MWSRKRRTDEAQVETPVVEPVGSPSQPAPEDDPTPSTPTVTGPRRIVRTSDLMLPIHGTVRRRPPRAPEDQQEEYHEWFDSETVFCDVIRDGEDLVMVGPPLFNLTEVFQVATWSADGQPLEQTLETAALNRAQTSWLRDVGPVDELAVHFAGEHHVTVRPSAPMHDLLADRTVLLAMQRNNPFHWIREWVEFHRVINGIDAVIIYDMCSTAYSAEELMAALTDLPVKSIIIVTWPYKYGARPKNPGDPWDSDFGQYVAWEHCKQRFLGKAKAITVSDLDELYVARDGRTIFEHAAESPSGAVVFKQRFIESAVEGELRDDTGVPFSRYVHFDPSRPTGTPKYAAILDRLPANYQLLVHSIAKANPTPTDEIVGYQYMPIKLNWAKKSFDRRFPDVPVTSQHEVDEQLRAAFERVAKES